MTYTNTEIALAKRLFEQEQISGAGGPLAVAVMAGISRPNARHVVRHQPSYRDYLARARASLGADLPKS